MTRSFRSSIYLDFYRFHRFISKDTSVHQTVRLLTIELQLRVEG